MAEQLLKIANLFRVTAAQLRRLARGPIHTERDTIVAVEAYLDRNQVRTADAFPPDPESTGNNRDDGSLELSMPAIQRRPI
ncbi:MAG: hypothetical protein WCA22_17490 [Candidatus Binatus sp.]